MFEIVILTKDGVTLKRVELSGDRVVRIGRSKQCDIRLPVGSISRRHLELVPMEDSNDWLARDLGSTHGTIVDGERVDEVMVSDGLEASLGAVRLRFESLTGRIGKELDELLSDEDESDNATVTVLGGLRPASGRSSAGVSESGDRVG